MTMTTPKTKSEQSIVTAIEVNALGGDGTFAGYACVYGNVTLAKDIWRPGCYADSLKAWAGRGDMPRCRYGHGSAIGSISTAKEDDHGLYVTGQLWLDDEYVAEVYDMLRDAMPNVGMSCSFVATEYEVVDDIRTITAADLMDDISITLCPVNPQAALTELNSRVTVARPKIEVGSVERVLREAGFSRSIAKGLAAHGVDGVREARRLDLTPHTDTLSAILQALA